jgi:hypothetical protein
MKRQIKPAVLYQVQAGEFHNSPHLLPVARSVTVGLAFLAHRLGVRGIGDVWRYHGSAVSGNPDRVLSARHFQLDGVSRPGL